MQYTVGEKVKGLPGVFFKNVDLSGRIGIVTRVESYVYVKFIGCYEDFKMMTDEIEIHEEEKYALDDLWSFTL